MLQAQRFPMIFDGAFGTYYFSLTGDKSPPELANLTNPEQVEEIHQAYLTAGADAIKTNTFGANYMQIPDDSKRAQVLAAGWEIAQRAAAKTDAQVFADIGNMEGEHAAQGYLENVEQFCALGANRFLFETLNAFEPLIPALKRIRVLSPNAIVFVSFAVAQDGFSRRGLHYRRLVEYAASMSAVDAVGLNCACGPSHMLSLLKELDSMHKPLIAMPNAGYPAPLNGRMVYEDNSCYFAGQLAKLYQAGADILGGCCGSTPEHIRQGAQQVRAACRRPSQTAGARRHAAVSPRGGTPSPTIRKLLAVELDAPADADCTFAVSAAVALRREGVDLITVADSPLSRARADSVMTAAHLRRESGVETMPHMTCRDRNRIAIKASLLGAATEGIRYLLAITGDPPPGVEGGVFHLNSYELIRYAAQLNSEALAACPLHIAGALNVNAHNFEVELERAEKKLECGASMLLTQAIFSEQAEENYRKAKKSLNCTLLAGILPVAGYKNALFLHNEVSGIGIPSRLLEELREALPEQAQEIAVAHSAGVVERLFNVADGFYIMTPLRKVEIVQRLVRLIREKETQTG